jgi:hypothetical protein
MKYSLSGETAGSLMAIFSLILVLAFPLIIAIIIMKK